MHVYQVGKEYRAADADYSIVTEQAGDRVGWWTKDDEDGRVGAPCGVMNVAMFLEMVDRVPLRKVG